MSGWMILPLADVLKHNSQNEVERILSTFKCSKDRDLEDFLVKRAVDFERRWIARTYLVTEIDNMKIVAYFSVALKCMYIPQDAPVSNNLKKRMNVDGRTGVAQSYLIGQISRSDNSEKGIGSDILDYAVDIIRKAAELVGCRMIRLDCKDGLVSFYERNGFIHIGKNESNDLNQLVMVL